MKAKLLRLTGTALAIVCLSATAFTQGTAPLPDPEAAGFSTARLARIAPWYQSQIDAGVVTGAVMAIARDGKLAYLQAIGTQDRAGKTPLNPDALFWIASMTKPVTSVAAMMLVEEGKLDLAAPVADYLPELKDLKVGLENPRPPKRPMQVIDLLRHTSGLTYPEEGTDTLHRAYGKVGTFKRDRTLADFVAGLAVVPLLHEPGEVWEYSWGVDVLARVIEVVSGQTFDKFLKSRLFEPLRMVDTSFAVPEDKISRLVDPPAGRWSATWDVTKPTKLFSGGGGLVSTATDYLRFCQMLLNGGELDGARILSAATVRQMTTDALLPGTRFAGVQGTFLGPLLGTSWGLGFAIRVNPEFSLLPGAVGSYNWSGVFGQYFWIDPSEKLIGIQLIHLAPEKNSGQFRNALRHLTYAALRVPEQPAPATSPTVPIDILSTYAGTYDFGPSLSAHDRQAPLPAFAGLSLQVTIVEGLVTVRAAIGGGAAAKAGVLADDVITEIDDVSLKGLGIAEVLDKMRGAVGTEVQLRIARKGQDKPLEFTIIRQLIRSPGAQIEVRVAEGKLTVEATGPWSVLDFEKGKSLAVQAISSSEFRVESGDHTRLAFAKDQGGKVIAVVLNPGAWEITAAKIK
jgi:CubicO group peptidase (beta-lactamase class C family)